MISPPLDGLYHYKRTVELSIESVRSAPHRVRFAPQNHPLYSADCRELRGLDLLILDEWGYVPVDKDGSQLLFRVISDSYESKSLILTTNLEFSKWGGIFTDDQMAAAMIDRLVHHGHLLIFEGKSYRMEHALMRRDA